MKTLMIAVLLLVGAPAWAETHRIALGDRIYRIDLPDNPRGAPLLLALHGGGGSADQFARASRLSGPGTASGYAVIYPEGSGRSRLKTWNAVYCCAYAQRERVDDVAFLDAVIADASSRFGLDNSRIYLTGMSNGSMMAETYAALRPGRVSAVAGVAGTFDTDSVRVRGQVPMMHIHGTADDMVPYQGGQGGSSLTRTDFSSVADVVSAFRRAAGSGLRESSRVIDPARDGMRVIETTWSRGGRPWVRLMTIEGGGHAWPGAARNSRKTTRDIDANSEILRFFAAFR